MTGLADPAWAAEQSHDVEVSQEERPNYDNPEELIQIWNDELSARNEVPRHAFEALWSHRGWVEVDMTSDFDSLPWNKTAQASESEELGADSEPAAPAPKRSRGSTPESVPPPGGEPKE